MTNRWRIQATVPDSQASRFEVRGFEGSDSTTQTSVFFMEDTKPLKTDEVRQELRHIENELDCKGVQDFSLEATPLTKSETSRLSKER
jgi:hypothetical protein